MGIMLDTARALGATLHELKDPDTRIRTRVDRLWRFRQGSSRITDPGEEIKFTLVTYSAGTGYIYNI